MVIWISLGLLIGVVTAFFTLVWWKVGDQWADEEYKKFGHGGGGPKGPPPKVISNFDAEPTVIASADDVSEPEHDRDPNQKQGE